MRISGPTESNTERLAGLILTAIRWLVLIGVAIFIATIVIVMATQAQGQPLCPAWQATQTRVVYQSAGDNTAVKLQTSCPYTSAEWYVGFFEGAQPTLWEWYGLQNTASDLLYGD
jgi:hypothetical protein